MTPKQESRLAGWAGIVFSILSLIVIVLAASVGFSLHASRGVDVIELPEDAPPPHDR